MGGLSTIQSYVGVAKDDVCAELNAAVPSQHVEFLSSCQHFFETKHFIASHAGLNPSDVGSRDPADIILGRNVQMFENSFRTAKLVICGHYLQRPQTPLYKPGLVCLDTGCGTIGGPLTALLYPEMTFLQE